MLRSSVYILLIMFCCSGCDYIKSDPQLSDEEQVDLWIDLHTAQMVAQNFPSDQRDSIEQVFIEDIATHYQLTPVEVNQFMEDMQEKPEEMLKLYDAAMDTIKQREHELRTKPGR